MRKSDKIRSLASLRLRLDNHVPFHLPRSLAAAFAALAAAAPPSQINIHYTQTPGTLSVDFVSQAADGVVQFGASAMPSNMRNATTTSFAFLEIGFAATGSRARFGLLDGHHSPVLPLWRLQLR